MRALMPAATLLMMAMVSPPLFAQERGPGDSRGYVSGYAGFASSVGHTTGDVMVEGGVRIAPHLKVFGDLGHFSNLQAELQPTLDNSVNTLAANQNLTVVGGGTIPAWYGLGGLRFDIPTGSRFFPFVLGGLGVARLNPTPQFLFGSGILPDGTVPQSGADVTSMITSAGLVTTPESSSALMYTLGGGLQVPLAPRWGVEVGYRYSRIAADTSLSTTPLNTNGMTFGVAYHF